MNSTNSILRNYRLGQTMKITPISESSVAVAVIADEENVIATKNFDGAPGEDDADVDERSSSSSRWNKCLIASIIAGVVALIVVVAICASLPLIYTRETESGAVQSVTFGMNQSGEFTRFINSITSNGQHGTCSIDEEGYSITYTPDEGFFGVDTCTYTVVECTDTHGCDNSTEETASFYIEDPDAPVTSPDTMVLVSDERTESTTSTPPTAAAAAAAAQKTTAAPDEEGVAPPFAAKSSVVANPCSECSITNGQNNFCGKLGIYTFLDACESQTECDERGLACMTCSSVEGYNEDVGNGAYICVEEGGDKASDVTTTTTTTTLPTTTSSSTINSIEASLGGIESIIGKKWKARKIMWRLDSSVPEELKDATEEDKYPIILDFMSDTRVGGTCGNNSCSIKVNIRADQIMFVGKFRRTRMVASEQEQNYVYLLQGNTFNYQVIENGNGSLELDLKEIETGQLVATYVQLSSEEEVV